MADTAAHLVDRVFPAVPVRQWVLSLPFALRYRLAYDASLVTDVLRIFVSVVFGSVRRRAGFAAADRTIRCGSVTFVQRFGGKLNLNVHFHMLALDGAYAEDKRGHIRFHRVPPPSDAEVTRAATRIHRRVVKLLERRDLRPQADPQEADTLGHAQPLLADLYSASVSGRVATGPRTGHRLMKLGDKVHGENPAALSGPRCNTISGFSRNYSWAQLMRRVFAVDVLECPDCHSRMRILAAIHPPHAIRKILLCLGLPPRPPPVAPALPDCEMDEMYAS